MSLAALSFLNPWLLAGLASLPLIYWLLRTVPPRPRQIEFPPTRILKEVENQEKTPANTPWWLLLIRLLAAALVIFALAGPVYDPSKQQTLDGNGPVILVVDNSWAAAAHWPDRGVMIERFVNQAEAAGRSIVIAPTALGAKPEPLKMLAASEAREIARALKPQPFAPDFEAAAKQINQLVAGSGVSGAAIIWLHDGIDRGAASIKFATKLSEKAEGGSFISLDLDGNRQPIGVFGQVGENGKLQAVIQRPTGPTQSGTVTAFSARSERLAETGFDLSAGERSKTVDFNIPLELRNQVARIELNSARSAGAVHLLDGRSHWQRVGLISGGDQEQAQPVLSPLYYIERALKPFAELAKTGSANLADGLEELLNQNVTLLMLTDIGRLPEGARDQVDAWLKKGGVLVRFAGPRLEKGGDDLLPVPIRLGGRTLGGALSWSAPQPLAPFDEASLFQGLELPQDVTVQRQVLADPAQMTGDVRIHARLKDGTPLVTARAIGQGQVILFHVTANSDWSNLPLSGLFVEMLRRITTLGSLAAVSENGNGSSSSATATGSSQSAQTLAPVETLDGFGTLQSPPPMAEALDATKINTQTPSAVHPPGYYGPPATPRALNVLNAKSDLRPLDISAANPVVRSYESRAALSLKPWLLLAALGLLFADMLAVLWMQLGGVRSGAGKTAEPSAAMVCAVMGTALALAFAAAPAPAFAQTTTPSDPAQTEQPKTPDALGQMATSKVTFGYVLTGDAKTDSISQQGLAGLARVLTVRTAVEPGRPLGVDIEKDEIAFYPVLYWPVLPDSKPLKPKTLAKIDAYMKQGGMIIFDTRDYGSGLPTGVPLSGEGGTALQRLLGRLDLPRLEPVPDDHVLTKSFYLLTTFPGRWDGGELWVEAEGTIRDGDQNKARRADGVTSILITSNDFAAAWALDQRGRGLYPTVPGGEDQREMAFRTGVNIVMHALTGNYKADQVHVPSLLERLGQ